MLYTYFVTNILFITIFFLNIFFLAWHCTTDIVRTLKSPRTTQCLRHCVLSCGTLPQRKNENNFYTGLNWGRSWRSGTKCDCKTDWLWVRSPLEEMKYLLKFIFPSGVDTRAKKRLSAALSSATQHAMPPEFGRKWGTECLSTRFSLPILLCSGRYPAVCGI